MTKEIDFDWSAFGEVSALRNKIEQQQAEVSGKDDMISELQDALVTLKEEIDFLEKQPVQSVAKDLAKKNKQLRQESRRERDKVVTLMREKQQMEKEVAMLRESIQPKAKDADSSEVWKSKHMKATEKLGKIRAELSQKDILCKKLKAALKKEIGADVDVNAILSEHSKWRGRSETIARLKAQMKMKEKEMKQIKLENLQFTHSIDEDLNERQKKRAQRRYQDSVIKLERELASDQNATRTQREIEKTADQRRREMESLREDLSAMTLTYQKLKEKYDAQSSRLQTLQDSSRTLREKVKIILDKSSTDDKLIEELKSKLKQERRLRVQASKQMKQSQADESRHIEFEKKLEQLKKELQRHKQENESLSEEVVRLSNARAKELSVLLQDISSTQQSYETEFYKSENMSLKQIIAEYKSKTSMKSVNTAKASSRRNSKALADMNSRLRKMEETNLSQAKELETCYEMVNQQRLAHDSALNSISQKFCEVSTILEAF